MLVAVAGQVTVVAVNHRQAGTHEAREVEGGDAGPQREGRERMAQVVRSPQRLDPRCPLRGLSVLSAEVVQVQISAARRWKQEGRVWSRRKPIESVQRDRLQRHRAHAPARLRALQTSVRKCPAHIDDPRGAVEVAMLDRDPFAERKPVAAANTTIGGP